MELSNIDLFKVPISVARSLYFILSTICYLNTPSPVNCFRSAVSPFILGAFTTSFDLVAQHPDLLIRDFPVLISR